MQESTFTPYFYIVLPAKMRYDARLQPMSKIIYGELASNTDINNLCYATNKDLADEYHCKEAEIQACIENLHEAGWIDIVHGGKNRGIFVK